MNLLRTNSIILGGLCFLLVIAQMSTFVFRTEKETSNLRTQASANGFSSEMPDPAEVSVNNYDLINTVLDIKNNQFSINGYYNQSYESSLQATYQALYCLKALDALESVDQEALILYILDHYNASRHCFRDTYSKRYLDTDFSLSYYPFNTELETTCYAILSLNFLGALDQINTGEIVNYIMSCYNVDDGGFIGQPYDVNLEENFKISTMDNTFYAIMVIDLLDDWEDSYPSRKLALRDYIDSMQMSTGGESKIGGFSNDEDSTFNSIKLKEPNLLSAYYCLKSLDIFNALDVVDTTSFNQWLDGLYFNGIFQMSYDFFTNYSDVIASAIAQDVAVYTGFNAENAKIIDFIYSNFANNGAWKGTSHCKLVELMHTFLIIRSLNTTGDLLSLTAEQKGGLIQFIDLCFQYLGYSPHPKSLMGLELLWTVIRSFYELNRYEELDTIALYNIIKKAYFKEEYYESHHFKGLASNIIDSPFYIYPIEYYTTSLHAYLETTEEYYSYKWMYFALDSLRKLGKLGDFEASDPTYELSDLVDQILTCQFLEAGYSNYGGFFSLPVYTILSDALLNKYVFFENSYYAVKCLELLADYLDLGEVKNLGLNNIALYNFITVRNLQQESLYTYFENGYINNPETVLQYTYQAVEMLKILDSYDLNTQHINNYIIQALDYSNIKNIYYCYKLAKLLNLDMDFDNSLVQDLIQVLYSEKHGEFLQQSTGTFLEQEVLWWICDMAQNDELEFNINSLEHILLGSNLCISISPSNLILTDFGPDITYWFESDKFGYQQLNKTAGNMYENFFYIPFKSDYFPSIAGTLYAKMGTAIKASAPIIIQTDYDIEIDDSVSKEGNMITFNIEASLIGASRKCSILDGKMEARIYRDGNLIKNLEFQVKVETEVSKFSLKYEVEKEGDYTFKIFLLDGISSEPNAILEKTFNYGSEEAKLSADMQSFSLIVISSCIGMPLGVVVVVGRKVSSKKRRFLLS
ncbi:MAG: prenyltransferase/squalene oxidase repeat-containing protein [Promethearchaeota archaeon]